jgi:hypothetical protein
MSAISFADSTWPQIELVRAQVVALKSAASVQAAAQAFTTIFAQSYSTVVLARLFAVLPLSRLPPNDQAFALHSVAEDGRLKPSTRVLSLLGSSGVESAWNSRQGSKAHLAIPLLDRAFVQGAPMIARLLSDLGVDLALLDKGSPIATRRMLGGNNSTFFVPDAQTTVDEARRSIIPALDFVRDYKVRTVFGMGGAYVDGSLAVAIIFSSELIERIVVDRFPSLISNFKMATGEHQAQGRIFDA